MQPTSSIEGIRYTSQLEEACNILADTRESQSDIHIVHLVKLQQITRKIRHTFYDLEIGFGSRIVPRKMCIELLQKELDRFQEELPENLRSNCKFHPSIYSSIHPSLITPTKVFISINYSIAEINLYEIGLHDANDPALDNLERLGTLNSCLLFVKTFLDTKVTFQKVVGYLSKE